MRSHRFPLLTLTLAGAALASWSFSSLAEWLQYDRAAISTGEWWRLITCHLTHWTTSHLAWDLVMFVVLGAVIEMRSRRAFTFVSVASSVAIGCAVLFLQPDLATYRGLSGLDSALFAVVLTQLVQVAVKKRNRAAMIIAAAAVVGFLSKTALEAWTGQMVFVDSGACFSAVPFAHLVGALSGILATIAPLTADKLLLPVPSRISPTQNSY